MSSWIEWVEKKPNKTCDILCTTSSGRVVVAEYQKEADMIYFQNPQDAETVIAWMPLPKKYDQISLGDHVIVIGMHGSAPGVVVGIKKHDCGIKYCVLYLADPSPIAMRPYELVYLSRGEFAKVKGSSVEFAMVFNEAAASLRYRESNHDDR